MKIRVGFVSNSSSSSFCIYGRELESEEIEMLREKYGIDDDDDVNYSVGEKIMEETSLSVERMDYNDNMYVGRSFTSIKDDETGAQFKKDVEDNVKALLNTKDAKCHTYEESWNS